MALLSGLLVGFSQPILIESISGKQVLDQSGFTGLLAFVGLVPAFIAIDGQGPKRAYAVGFVTWFVAFSIIVHWILTTVHVYGGLPLIVGLAVLALLTSALAAYVAASFAVTRIIVRYFNMPQWAVLPVVVGGVELLRNYGPVGGFPWGSLGHSFATTPVYAQSAAIVGVTGLTVLATAINAGIASAIIALRRRERPVGAFIMVVVVFMTMSVYGNARLLGQAGAMAQAKTVKIALLQPNVNEGLADLVREDKGELLQRFYEMQREALAAGAQIVFWPEGSFPRRGVNRDIADATSLKIVPPDVEAPELSIVGISAIGPRPPPKTKVPREQHNSGFVIDKEQRVLGRFDKSHLVPFGEYVPWPFGSIVRQFIPLGAMTPGTKFEAFDATVDGVKHRVGITICYEGVFPEINRALANDGATFIANLTDDRWYGVSGMATQHLLMYVLRAIESGRPIARATNTGISAWIDVTGGIHKKTGMYEPAVVVDDMSLHTVDTVYLALGDWLAFLCLLATLGLWLFALVGGRTAAERFVGVRVPIVIGGVVAVVAGLVLWLTSPGLDEARSTQSMLLVIAGLLVAQQALKPRRTAPPPPTPEEV